MDPFLQQSEKGGVTVDRHTTLCRAIDGSAGLWVGAHAASPDVQIDRDIYQGAIQIAT